MVEHVACIVCPHVLREERPVRLLIHHHDGTWQAMCGERDHTVDGSDCRVVGVNHLFARQADLAPLASLPREQIAEWRSGEWDVAPFDENDASGD
jgi:hypothetical protein